MQIMLQGDSQGRGYEYRLRNSKSFHPLAELLLLEDHTLPDGSTEETSFPIMPSGLLGLRDEGCHC
jgi:hypothetical protein